MAGACDANGREVIPPMYDIVLIDGEGTEKKPFYFHVERDGNMGACDLTGKEIVPPIYKTLYYFDDGFNSIVNGKRISLGIYLNPDGTLKESSQPVASGSGE